MPDRQRGEDAVIDTRNDADTPPPWRSRRPDQAATPITTQATAEQLPRKNHQSAYQALRGLHDGTPWTPTQLEPG